MLDGNWIPSSFGTTKFYGVARSVSRGLGVKSLTSTFVGGSRVVPKSLEQYTTVKQLSQHAYLEQLQEHIMDSSVQVAFNTAMTFVQKAYHRYNTRGLVIILGIVIFRNVSA